MLTTTTLPLEAVPKRVDILLHIQQQSQYEQQPIARCRPEVGYGWRCMIPCLTSRYSDSLLTHSFPKQDVKSKDQPLCDRNIRTGMSIIIVTFMYTQVPADRQLGPDENDW